MTKLPVGLTLNARIEIFERAHPEILIAAPWATRTGRWQVIVPEHEAESYERGTDMMTDLEKRYPL